MAYRIDGWDGIAWYRIGYKGGDSLMVMVGDDRVFEVETEHVHRIEDKDYCSACGQIGCTCDGRERS